MAQQQSETERSEIKEWSKPGEGEPVNVREHLAIITLNISGTGHTLKLNHFESTEPPARKESVIQQAFAERILWENDKNVSPKPLKKAIVPNGYELARVLYNDRGRKFDWNKDTGRKDQVPFFKTKLVFKTAEFLDANPDERMEFTEEQEAEVRALFDRTYMFCHAKWYEGPIPNIQVALLNPTEQKALRTLTVRKGVLQTVLAKDLNAEERASDAGARLINRLIRRGK